MKRSLRKFKPVDKSLLKEEASKMLLLSEYNFWIPEFDNKSDDLILGEEGEEEEEIEDVVVDEPSEEPEMEDDIDLSGGEEEMKEPSEEPEMEEPEMEEPEMEEPAEDEVEVDITQLVQSAYDTKQTADMTNSQVSDLLGKFQELQGQLQNMSNIGNKIDNLEKEMERRNPTPQEKLEMRSLDSYPYSVKLTDYWSNKEDHYDVMGNNGEDKPEEYVLTQDEVDNYNPSEINNSFDEEDYYE